jgi:diacylglycerol kinase family enzyme
MKQLLGMKPMDATVVLDGVTRETYSKVLLASSMIHRYEGGGLMMAPDADPTDGKLSVCLAHGFGRIKVLVLLPLIFFGKHIHFKGVETFHCSNIQIITSRNSAVHTDGEVADSDCSHITVSCVPGQIRMIL